MKVYVDKLPKNCFECPCFSMDKECPCGVDNGENYYFKDEVEGENCPLKSLAEHDKQVRKQVIEEIREKFKEIIFDSSTIDEILDKIGGEKE